MSFTLTPNMFLRVPTVGDEPGPDYALDVNVDMAVIDAHDHTPGKGVQITPAGFDINVDLPFNDHFAIDLAGLTLSAQAITPSVNTIYESGVDLFFVDGLGNNIRITQGGSIAGTPGSISGLVPPASASYSVGSQTFVFQSNVNTAANIDGGSIIIREVLAAANGVTIRSPTALSANYTLTLPSGLPASTKLMTLSAAGNIAAVTDVDNTTIEISSNNLQVKDGGITVTKLAPLPTPTVQILLGAGTYTTPAGTRRIVIKATGAGSGGGASGITGGAGPGTAGTDSTFGPITASAGAAGGAVSTVLGGAGGGYTVGAPAVDFGSSNGGYGGGGTAMGVANGTIIAGGHGGASSYGSGGSGGYSSIGANGVAIGSGGAGGGGYNTSAIFVGVGGGAGGTVIAQIVSPAATYAFSVGSGGGGGIATDAGAFNGGSGASGAIIVEEYYF